MTAGMRREIVSDGPDRTRELAEKLARDLPAGTVISLIGELGAGKTVFVSGLARGLGCPHAVCSPTFVLLRVYDGGRLPLYHLDAYRLRNAADLSGAGADELLPGNGITAVEWGDRVAAGLPSETLRLTLSHVGRETQRRLAWECDGTGLLRAVDACWMA